MNDKLKNLTEKIYNEGIEKAQIDSEKIIHDANKKAKDIISKAEQDAAEIKQKAQKDIEGLEVNMKSDLRLAQEQLLTALKQKITNIITTKITSDDIKDSFKDTKLLQEMIGTIISNWRVGEESLNLNLILKQEDKDKLDGYLNEKLLKTLQNRLTINVNDQMEKGFSIGPEDGSFKIHFDEDEFINLFKGYLREKTIALLFK